MYQDLKLFFANDKNPYNNLRTGLLRVKAEKQHIIILNSQLNYDAQFISKILKNNDDFAVYNLVSHSSKWIPQEQFAIFQKKWDLAILIGYPAANTSENQLLRVKRKIEDDSVPCFILYNERTSKNKLNRISGNNIVNNLTKIKISEPVFADITDENQDHPVLRDFVINRNNLNPWRKLPPIGYPFANVELNRGFQSLVNTANISESPIISVRESDGKREAICFGVDLWRWYLMTRENSEIDMYGETLNRIVSWLSDSLSASNIQMTVDKSVYLTGESVKISGSVFDVKGNFLPRAIVSAVAKNSVGDEIEFNIPCTGNIFEGELPLTGDGDYKIEIFGKLGNMDLGAVSQEITVIDQPLELVNVRQEGNVLRSIAYRTGGKKIMPEQLETISNLISYNEKKVEENYKWKMWRRLGSFILLVLLVVVEWSVRRIFGYQ